MTTIAQEIGKEVEAMENCTKRGKTDCIDDHQEKIEKIIKEFLPSGSGIDYGTTIDYKRTTQNRIVLTSAYHVMDENGYYAGIIDYRVIITASLAWGFDLNIVGNFASNKDAYGIKDYLFDLYIYKLSEEYEEV